MKISENAKNIGDIETKKAVGLYNPEIVRGACGVGFLARLDVKPEHHVVKDAIKLLINLQHRGAVGGDESTGDGAGILLQIPDAFFRFELSKTGQKLPPWGDYAAGMIFLPKETSDADAIMRIFENIAENEGCGVIAWREVPVSEKSLGSYSLSTKPGIRQIFLSRQGVAKKDFERKLFVIRRLAEKSVSGGMHDRAKIFYVSSLSSRTIVYKGLLTGSQLTRFYPDLRNRVLASPYALVHQRYSTNTAPTWQLAQPFRMVAHNGEINTLKGNINQMRSREADLSSPLFGEDLERIKPILVEDASDSSIFDNMAELLVRAGRPIPQTMMIMVPEAWGSRFIMSADKRAFYDYYSSILEPWDGPAALMFCDGRYIGATVDRNGLRPARYTLTTDGLVIMASETGVLDIAPERVRSCGHLRPGKMFLVDLQQKRIMPDNEIKSKVSRYRPYRHWIKQNQVELKGLFQLAKAPRIPPEQLHRIHHAFGYTAEELKMVLKPMASQGQEAIGSMGNDTALAVFADRPQLLFSYFKQLFAQVTNPPIDPLREEMVMSLMGWVGAAGNLFEEVPENCRRLKLNHPILTPDDLSHLRMTKIPELLVCDIDTLFEADLGPTGLATAMEELCQRAEQGIEEGGRLLVLSDWKMNQQFAPIPSLLALSGVHHHLIEKGLRNRVGIICDSAEAREVAHFALLIGFGASAICPYGAMATVASMASKNALDRNLEPNQALEHYVTAIKKGLLKTFSRMGISTLRSYQGAQIFEAIGLSDKLIEQYFQGTPSRIGGIGLEQIAMETLNRHRRAFPKRGEPPKLLDMGGTYHYKVGGERHLWSPEAIYKLQHAVRTDDYQVFKEYTRLIDDQSQNRATLRSLFQFKAGKSVPLDKVEPATSIAKRFVTAAMSYGSISKEAHETVAIAMNRLGAKSNSGEGGEAPERFIPLPNGDSKCSAIKQVASGRFGVTTKYLINADELQIKIAQGAKPGEGGQLPGKKVSAEIARVRHTTEGVTLISPPPHHDIYSIEDLAQLIYDLKSVNSRARVSVKLVSEVGVGAVAAGVAKALADVVLVSGCDGGTGASPLTSIMHAGTPWELGLAETQQALITNRLRSRIRLQVDGQLKTGRDLAIAALMGAEEFGFGTTILVCLGCVMMRKCHKDTCPVGVATQNPELRKRFSGKPEYVQRFLLFMAEQMREYMSELGFATVDEMVGQIDRLETQGAVEHWKSKGLDLSPILFSASKEKTDALRCLDQDVSKVETPMDDELIRLSRRALEDGKPIVIHNPIRNIHRAVGARLSGEIIRRFDDKGLPSGTIRVQFTGSAGQSFGAFLAPGVDLRVAGDANDYLGKGMSGGRIVLAPHPEMKLLPHENAIVGNTVLFGATGGEVYISGIAGMRFAVRNSGACAVVEGVGPHGCEYMTGGAVVVLGTTGYNFAAGMSGGIAYIYDENQLFDTHCNLDMVELETVWTDSDVAQLREMIEKHFQYTSSPQAKMILENWEAQLPLFIKVIPIDYRKALERMRQKEEFDEDAPAATEEVFSD